MNHRIDLAADEFHQGTFAGPIGAQHHGVLTKIEPQAEVVKDAPLAQVGGHTLQFQVGRWAHGFMMQRRLRERRS